MVLIVKRTALALTLVLALLMSATANTLLVNFGNADPFAPPPPPTFFISSPEDKVYDSGSILLAFNVTVPSTWGYSTAGTAYPTLSPIQYWVDGQLWGEFTGGDISNPYSITLKGLTNGYHSVEVTTTLNWSSSGLAYFEDFYNTDFTNMQGSSGKRFFTINVTSPKETEPFPTATAATAAGASVTIIGVGLLVYFRKRKP